MYTIYTEAVPKTYPPNIVEILGIVTTPIIFFQPFKLIADTMANAIIEGRQGESMVMDSVEDEMMEEVSEDAETIEEVVAESEDAE